MQHQSRTHLLEALDLLGAHAHLASPRDALAQLHVLRDGVPLARPQRAAPARVVAEARLRQRRGAHHIRVVVGRHLARWAWSWGWGWRWGWGWGLGLGWGWGWGWG